MKKDSQCCAVLWEHRAKIHVCLDSIQMCYVCSEHIVQPEDVERKDEPGALVIQLL